MSLNRIRVDRLTPLPQGKELFAWSHHARVPAQPGCYAIANFSGDVLYVGQAKVSIRDRMRVHLDDNLKRACGPMGAAYWFYYRLCEPRQAGYIEGGWINQAKLETGDRPPLNKIDSPL